MNTNFRKQLEAVEVPIPSSAQGLFNAPQTIGTFLGSDLVDAIVKLHEAELDEAVREAEETMAEIEFKSGINHVTMSGEWITREEHEAEIERIIGDDDEPRNTLEHSRRNFLRAEQRQRAAVEPKKEGE